MRITFLKRGRRRKKRYRFLKGRFRKGGVEGGESGFWFYLVVVVGFWFDCVRFFS